MQHGKRLLLLAAVMLYTGTCEGIELVGRLCQPPSCQGQLWQRLTEMTYRTAMVEGNSLTAPRSQGETSKRGSVTGTVVEYNSDEPIRKAVVILHGEGAGIGTTTDATGIFEFHDLDPGAYTLTVRRDGYVVPRESRRQVVTIKAGETNSALKLKLLRTGAISGQILDVDGEPIAGAHVQVLPLRSKRLGMPGGSYATTNDRGEYRVFNISPGEYKLSVDYMPQNVELEVRMQRPVGNDGRSVGGTYPTVYYPGTIDTRQATVVTVGPGAELEGYDVQMIRASGVRVRGRVTGPATGNSTFLFIMIDLEPATRGQSGTGQLRHTLVRVPNGEFEFTDVLPGRYHLNAVMGGFNQESNSRARQTLEVGESDVEGVQLTLGLPRKLNGRVIAPEGRTVLPRMIIMLGPREPGDTQGGGSAQSTSDGSFTIKDVISGDYDVSLASSDAPDDLYVSAIRMGDTDVLADGLHIGDSPIGSLDIILKANGGKAECRVKNDAGEAVPEAMVLLVPDAPRQRQFPLYGDCGTKGDGKCTIAGITPGEYHAYAFPVDFEIDYRDPDELKSFEKYGKTVRFAEGDRVQLELKTVPLE